MKTTAIIAILTGTAIILSPITSTFSINNTILLLNFISIIRLGGFMSMKFELINLTLLVLLVYIGLSSILALVSNLIRVHRALLAYFIRISLVTLDYFIINAFFSRIWFYLHLI